MLYNMINLADNHFALEEYDETILLQCEAISEYRELEASYDIKIANATFALAASYHGANQLVEAQPLYEEAIELFRALLGDFHEDTINSVDALMMFYTIIDQYKKAKPLALEVYFYRGRKRYRSYPYAKVHEGCHHRSHEFGALEQCGKPFGTVGSIIDANFGRKSWRSR